MQGSNLQDADLRCAKLSGAVCAAPTCAAPSSITPICAMRNWDRLMISDSAAAAFASGHGRRRATRFPRSDLRRARLAGADLAYANFGDCDLRGTETTGADSRETKLPAL